MKEKDKIKMKPQPILVTGSHRSGSTWVGQMIAASQNVHYIHEPFNNYYFSPGINHIKFDKVFKYISGENEKKYLSPIKKTIDLKYDLLSAINSEKVTLSNILKKVKIFLEYNKIHSDKKRVLIKDPIAIFSAEWLTQRFDMQTIVLIRHPAAFASSLKIKNWGFNFNNLLDQKLLIRDHLFDFRNEIEEFANNQKIIIDQACLLWRMIYYVVTKYQYLHKNWLFMKHEDISLEPLTNFQIIFDYLNLDLTPRIKTIIRQHSQADTNTKTELIRNSKSNIHTWKTRLTDEEINYTKLKVQDISQKYYSEEEWL